MLNETQDANPVDPSTTEIETTQNNVEGAQEESSTSEQAQVPSSQQQDANQGAVAGGIPQQNLYGEMRRKILEEITPVIQATVRESMLGVNGQQGPQPQQQTNEVKYQGKYGRRELETIINHPDASEQDKLFANRGLAYIEAKEDTLKEIDSRQEKLASQTRQGQAIQSIISDYPQVFNKQANSWNFSEPLFQRAMQFFNTDPRLQAFGNEGLRVAMDRAYAQMAREGQVKVTKAQVKLNSQQRQIDKNQSQAMNAGTLAPGKTPNGPDKSKAALLEAYKQNPENRDLRTAAFKHLIPQSWLT